MLLSLARNRKFKFSDLNCFCVGVQQTISLELVKIHLSQTLVCTNGVIIAND